MVKELNWCKFVVEQLQDAAKKMDKKTQCGGCLFLLEILYADSPAVDNVEISVTKARVAAWTRKLLDEVIKLDRNHDGSFGKLSSNNQDIQLSRIHFSRWMIYSIL